MPKTLLLDLDNTLLNNEMDTFAPAYFQGLARHMAPFVEPQLLISSLLAATRKMEQNQEPDLTLMEVFDSAFYPALNVNKADLQPHIEQFYAEKFPDLRHFTSPKPEAIALVSEALQKGYQVGIATNPLFPLTAIEQRLAWAGLPVDQFGFTLVPSYNRFHFAKPNPAYYAEFLAQMGCPNDPILMVGDEAELDMAGARQFGIPVFWTPSPAGATWAGPTPEPARGSLADVLPWFESASGEQLKNSFATPKAAMAILRATPAALQTRCRHSSLPLEAARWKHRPKPAEWSLTEILCHLRDVEVEVFSPRFSKVVNEVNPFLPGIDSDPWAEQREYRSQDGPQALADFTAKRKEVLALLANLSPEDWQRPARHAIFGPTHLLELAGFVVEHDRLHIQQIHRLLQHLS